MSIFDLLNSSDNIENQLTKEIAELENRRTSMMLQVDNFLEKISNLEAQIKVLRPEYESAHGVAKNLIGAKIKPLLQELNGMKENETLISRDIEDLTTLIHNKKLQLIKAASPDLTDTLEDAADDRAELGRDMNDQIKAGTRLRSQVICGNDGEKIHFPEDTSDHDELSGQLDALFGDEKDQKIDELSNI